MKARLKGARNPTYMVSAFEAFGRHVDQTSRFVGLAIPMQNLRTLMNWKNDTGSTEDMLSHAWGKETVDYIEDLEKRLQSKPEGEKTLFGRILGKAKSAYITSVFGANRKIVLKQGASRILAAPVLGMDCYVLPMKGWSKKNDELIARYTPELAYRMQGYATPEVAELTDNPGMLDRNKATQFALRGGAITWMDGLTVRSLWPWAEKHVQKHSPDLTQGTDEYYQEVARKFNEAVNITQPMYLISITTHTNSRFCHQSAHTELYKLLMMQSLLRAYHSSSYSCYRYTG